MTPAIVTTDNYLAGFDAFEAALPAGQPEWLRNLRRRAIARFREIGLPTARKGNEPWKYTNVAPIAETAFALDGACDASVARLDEGLHAVYRLRDQGLGTEDAK